MRTLIIMQGVPGSGKSTVAEQICSATSGTIRSTDSLRYVHLPGEEPKYNYVPELNSFHHEINRALVGNDMFNGVECVIVDNTNITQKQINPYLVMAGYYGYTVNIIRVDPGLEIALARNAARSEVARRVPEEQIRKWHNEMERLSALAS